MKLFSDKRIRIIVLVFVIAGAEAVESGGTFGTFAVFFEVIAFLWLALTLFSMLKSRKRQNEFSIGAMFFKAVMRILAPTINRIRRTSDRRTRFIYGTDKTESLKTERKDLRKSKHIKKRKIKIDRETENKEKVRLCYVKYVINAAESGKNITYANTPFEIMKIDENEDSAKLFELYSCVRYADDCFISDTDAELCKSIADSKAQ